MEISQSDLHLLHMFPRKWIGGIVNWLAHSTDLTSLDFFLWFCKKIKWCQLLHPQQLRTWKTEFISEFKACTEVTLKMLVRVRKCFVKKILKYSFVEGYIYIYILFCTSWINIFLFYLLLTHKTIQNLTR